MDNLEKKIKNSANRVFLSTEEKELIRSRLVAVMGNELETNTGILANLQKYVNLYAGNVFRIQMVPAYLVLLFVVGATTSYAAQGSLPGGALYPLKRFNEGARLILTSGTEAKAEQEIAFASERLSEVERLERKDEADKSRTESAESDFIRHSNSVKVAVKKLSNDGHVDVAIRINSGLLSKIRAHQDRVISSSEAPRLSAFKESSADLVSQSKSLNREGDAFWSRIDTEAQFLIANDVELRGELIKTKGELRKNDKNTESIRPEQDDAHQNESVDGKKSDAKINLDIDSDLKDTKSDRAELVPQKDLLKESYKDALNSVRK